MEESHHIQLRANTQYHSLIKPNQITDSIYQIL